MIKSSKASENFPLKQEGQHLSDNEKAKAVSSMSSPSSSSQWLRLKDPRIVRVSRAFGGKDRHSKVSTIKGLRDRRVRLSVPTAIQLYDLQDRLGLNQPSKVVDWLLNAAKHEIDELPPLPIPNYMINRTNIQWDGSTSMSKEVSTEEVVAEKAPNWINRSGEEGHKQESNNNECHDEESGPVLQNSLLPIRPNHPSLLGLLNNMPLGNYQWDSSSSDVVSDQLVTNVVPFSSTLSLSTGASQILVCPSVIQGATTQSFLHSSHVAAMEMDPRQINHYNHQMFNSSSSQNLFTSSMNPSQNLFSLNMMTPKLLHSPNSSKSPSHS